MKADAALDPRTAATAHMSAPVRSCLLEQTRFRSLMIKLEYATGAHAAVMSPLRFRRSLAGRQRRAFLATPSVSALSVVKARLLILRGMRRRAVDQLRSVRDGLLVRFHVPITTRRSLWPAIRPACSSVFRCDDAEKEAAEER